MMMVVQIGAGIPGVDAMVTDFVSAITAGSGVTPVVNARRTSPRLHATTWPGTGQAGDVATRRYKIKAAYLRRSFTEDQLATIHQHLSAPAGPSGGGMLLVGYGGQVQAAAPDATATAQRDVVMKAVYQTIWADESGDAANLTWIRDFYRDVYRDTGGVPVANDTSDGPIRLSRQRPCRSDVEHLRRALVRALLQGQLPSPATGESPLGSRQRLSAHAWRRATRMTGEPGCDRDRI